MKFSLFLTATALCFSGFSSAAAIKPRTESTAFKLYAYGSMIKDGLEVFIADGMAYAGKDAPSNASSIANITLSSKEGSTGSWSVTTDEGEVYDWGVTTSGGSLEAIGIAGENSTMNTTGFGLYGAWAYRLAATGEMQMNYRAIPTDTDDLYLIKWATASTTTDDNTLLVNLRTTAPETTSEKN